MDAFPAQFQSDLEDLMQWRRDVRHFKKDPVDEAVLTRCLAAFSRAPSVGLSEPWRLLRVASPAARAAAFANFQDINAQALAGYDGETAARYATLKLTGMREAPLQLAVFCDETTEKGQGLGLGRMPEMRRYSVVCAIDQFWLTARAAGLGVGWVSILDPTRLSRDLDAPEGWTLVAYLCIGWPQSQNDTPELERRDWERRATKLVMEIR
ncbi:5,6-dimethylbenzimidazole synthase [Roseobacteraceae bacterium S113]